MNRRQPLMMSTSQLLPRDLVMGLAMVAAGIAWLSWLHPATASDSLFTDVAVAAPCAFALVLLALPVTVLRLRLAEDTGANVPIAGLRCAALTAAAVAAGNTVADVLTRRVGLGLGTLSSVVDDASTLIVVLLPLAALTVAWRPVQPGPVRSPRRTGLVVGLALALPVTLGGLTPTSAATAATGAPMAAGRDWLVGGTPDKSFDITALNVDIPVTRFGAHAPAGRMYALTSRITAIRVEE